MAGERALPYGTVGICRGHGRRTEFIDIQRKGHAKRDQHVPEHREAHGKHQQLADHRGLKIDLLGGLWDDVEPHHQCRHHHQHTKHPDHSVCKQRAGTAGHLEGDASGKEA